jgi:hypothetical protein
MLITGSKIHKAVGQGRQDWRMHRTTCCLPLNAERNQGRGNVGTKSMPEPLPGLRGAETEHTKLTRTSSNEGQQMLTNPSSETFHPGPCVCAATAPRREGHQWWFALDSSPTSTHRHCMSVCLTVEYNPNCNGPEN